MEASMADIVRRHHPTFTPEVPMRVLWVAGVGALLVLFAVWYAGFVGGVRTAVVDPALLNYPSIGVPFVPLL
jgi:hypothetical protein